MPVPIICLDEMLHHFAQRFSEQLSKPQYQHFVTVLLGLMLCESTRTLSGLLCRIANGPSVAGLSRNLAEAPWETAAVVERPLQHFRDTMQPQVAAELQRQRQGPPKRRGRPKQPVVTGYLIGDDSTMHKPKGKKMEGLGLHHSTTQDKRVLGHSLVQSLYVLLGRRCPLAPQLYRQQRVCEAEGVPFESLIDLMEATIRTFEPVAGTLTHVLLDTWYSAKCHGPAARECGFLITTGLTSNRGHRVTDPDTSQGWRGPQLSDYTAHLSASDYRRIKWPKGDDDVYVHVVTTRVRKLYCCQVVIVRQSLDGPLSQARYWASSDLEADPAALLLHITARWDIEVLFGDGKEELGWDQYQLMSATAMVRFWTLAMLAYVFLEEECHRLQEQWQGHVTIGQARREIQRRHRRHVLDWLHGQFQSGIEPDSLYDLFSA